MQDEILSSLASLPEEAREEVRRALARARLAELGVTVSMSPERTLVVGGVCSRPIRLFRDDAEKLIQCIDLIAEMAPEAISREEFKALRGK